MFSSFGLLAGPLLTGALLGTASFTVTFLVLAALSALCLPYVTFSGPTVEVRAYRAGQEA